jgi:chromosome segregation ATPase
MQFNYQNVKTEDEYDSDFRNYGLLNKSIIDDEESHNNKIENLQNEIKSLQNRNKIVEDLCDNLRNSMKTILQNTVSLENELNNTRRKLVETEFALKRLMNKN